MVDLWTISESSFEPRRLRHNETVFTVGNGYLGTRGAFEEAYPGDQRTTLVHGMFDNLPVFFSELVNFPDWLELEIFLAGERFTLAEGELLSFERHLDLHNGLLTRTLRWRSPAGRTTQLAFRRFASLGDVHLACLEATLIPEDYSGTIEIRAGLDGATDNLSFKHWDWLDQGIDGQTCWLRIRTASTRVEAAMAARLQLEGGEAETCQGWDVHGHPTLACSTRAAAGQTVRLEKVVSIVTGRDAPNPLEVARQKLAALPARGWDSLWPKHVKAWDEEWKRSDVIIEGDDEAQLAIRFNIYHLLIAGPHHDERVNIGAKTLSGYGYRGHSFWDTEIFMLPFFTYTHPDIARNLLSYRFHNLPGAREKAAENGYAGAQYPWESAGDGREVTPTWVPNPNDRTHMIRIWTGDIEIHISADIAFAVWQYWTASRDEEFLVNRGTEIILETARFWASRAEWNRDRGDYEYSDVIGPDEYHDHVKNNAYTNLMARWHLRLAVSLAAWMKKHHPDKAAALFERISLKQDDLDHWQLVADHIYCPMNQKTGLIEQFEGYFGLKDVDLRSLEPRNESVQNLFGIEGANEIQVLKQPDVIMLMYLLPGEVDPAAARVNYDYYNPRTDLTFGSSLGPSIQAIMATRLGTPEQAYENFIRAARADLEDVRGNAGDGIHGASAGGLWQAVVFGFGGLQIREESWTLAPKLPAHWKRLAFKFVWRGKEVEVDLKG